MFLPLILEEEAEPVDWKCSNCGHSYKKHKDGNCSKGIFNKCKCSKFKMDQKQLDEVKKKLKEIEDTLFENLEEAKVLEMEIQP